MKRLFLVWDFALRGRPLFSGLSALAATPQPFRLVVPGLLADPGGEIWADEVEPGIRAADRVVVWIDAPNANVGFEAGYALGLDKEVLFLTERPDRRPAWTGEGPLAGIFQHAAPDAQALSALLASDRPWMRVDAPASVGAGVLGLCPRAGMGASAAWEVARHVGGVDWLEPNGWNLRSLPGRIATCGRVAWIVGEPAPGEERDGAENTRWAVVAGFARARGLDLRVFNSGSRDLADVVGAWRRAGTPAELGRLLGEWLGERAHAFRLRDDADAWRLAALLADRFPTWADAEPLFRAAEMAPPPLVGSGLGLWIERIDKVHPGRPFAIVRLVRAAMEARPGDAELAGFVEGRSGEG